MNPDNPLYYDPAELAALYVAGALSPDEVADVEARLAEGDRVLLAEIASYGGIIEAFSEGTPLVEPDSNVKQELLDRIASLEIRGDGSAAAPGRPIEDDSKVFIRRAQLGDWVDSGIPGIKFRVLFRDLERKVQTRLIRMAPGSELPEHRHHDFEECFVLEGEVESYGASLSAGDYARAPAGSHHGLTRTETGCLLLLTAELAS